MEETKSDCCGSGCNCGKPSGNKKLKVVICLVVLLAIGSVFAFKAKNGKQTAPVNTAAVFAVPAANDANEQKPTFKEVNDSNKVGVFLDSLATLNKVAVDKDAVFVFVPAKKSGVVSKEIIDAISSAEQKIKAKGINIGLYTLQSGSPEYANIVSQMALPGMLVMSKGKSMGAVSGGITEEKILQAYVASSRAGGCGPSGCGPSSSGCGTSAPIGPRVQ